MKVLLYIINIPRLLFAYLVYTLEKNTISSDLNSFLSYGDRAQKFSKSNLLAFINLLIFHKEYRNILTLRLSGWKKILIYLLFPRLDSLYITTKSKDIGYGILIVHGFSTIINAKKIGENCQIYQQVTIGHGNGGKPIIGNNVRIYAGAIIIGGITVGDNVTIGAGTVVTKSIPANTTVVGSSFRELGIRS
ncbi:serine acetyltransferase [uncultured Draconibacterium sp.]|uniref:serine O-acetyltransferase n=1 Tax=uncultured Draconibacterium sp. TaxID=1573823 RepID=UPI0029C9557B|nr:serine acetyltransferase [uncultured Draconibacterium sp.]